jgi:hypothetical protein
MTEQGWSRRDKIASVSIIVSCIAVIISISTLAANLYIKNEVIAANRRIECIKLLYDYYRSNPEQQKIIINSMKKDFPNEIIHFYDSLNKGALSPEVIETLGGWAGIDPYNNKYKQNIIDWSPNNRYTFYGGLVWDPQLITTCGDIYLIKDEVKNKISEWKNPPGGYKWSVDVTKYINDNGTYFIEWKWTEGKSGIHIVRSEITKE